MARSPKKVQAHGRTKVGSKELNRLRDHLGKSHGTFPVQTGWMTVSSGSSPPTKEPNVAEPLVQSVRTYLASEPHKIVVRVLPLPEPQPTPEDIHIAPDTAYLEGTETTLLKRNDLNNNSNNKLSQQKSTPDDAQTSDAPKPVDAGGMPSAAERLQRQPLLARCIKKDPPAPIDDSDPDPEDNSTPHRLPNGDFQIEIPPSGREERFPKEIWKTLLSFVFLCFGVMINMLSLALTHDRLPDKAIVGSLPDLFLDNVAPIEWALKASEILIMISTSTSTAVIIFHKHRFIVLRRVFFLVGLLYLYRSITMYVTVLPVSNPNYFCSPKNNATTPLIIFERMIYLLSGFGLTINGKHIYCGDSIYSGHTMILVLSYLIIAEYSPRRGIALHWAAAAAALAGVLLILLGHAHYMVDVIIAYYVTTRLFWTYHSLINRPQRQATPGMMSREWWYLIFCYFERNVGGPVPRHYNWPLPWPKAKLFSRLS